MATQAALRQRLESMRLGQPASALLESVLAVATVMSFLVASLFLARRVTGQLQRPLEFMALMILAAVAVATASGLRLAWGQVGMPVSTPLSTRPTVASVLWMVPSLTLLLLGIAVSVPGTSPVALALFWVLFLTADGVWWFQAWRLRSSQAVDNSDAALQAIQPQGATFIAATAASELADEDSFDEEDGEGELLPPGVTQQLTRTKDEHGEETVAGLLREQFQCGERSRSLHVAFCPPLNGRPKVDVVQVTGPRSSIKTAEVQPYGVRFDLRLAAPCQHDQDVLIHFEAQKK